MIVLAKDSRQATLIYDSAGPIIDDLTGYAESSDKKIRILDLLKEIRRVPSGLRLAKVSEKKWQIR